MYTPQEKEELKQANPHNLIAYMRALNGSLISNAALVTEEWLQEINEQIMGDKPLSTSIISKIKTNVIDNPRVTEDGKITDDELGWDDILLTSADIHHTPGDGVRNEPVAEDTPEVIDSLPDKDHPID